MPDRKSAPQKLPWPLRGRKSEPQKLLRPLRGRKSALLRTIFQKMLGGGELGGAGEAMGVAGGVEGGGGEGGDVEGGGGEAGGGEAGQLSEVAGG